MLQAALAEHSVCALCQTYLKDDYSTNRYIHICIRIYKNLYMYTYVFVCKSYMKKKSITTPFVAHFGHFF